MVTGRSVFSPRGGKGRKRGGFCLDATRAVGRPCPAEDAQIEYPGGISFNWGVLDPASVNAAGAWMTEISGHFGPRIYGPQK